MKTTFIEEDAVQFDRYSTDVNALLKRYRKEIPGMQKKKLHGKETFSNLYIFWFKDNDSREQFVV